MDFSPCSSFETACAVFSGEVNADRRDGATVQLASKSSSTPPYGALENVLFASFSRRERGLTRHALENCRKSGSRWNQNS
jgi:hypothetical protein